MSKSAATAKSRFTQTATANAAKAQAKPTFTSAQAEAAANMEAARAQYMEAVNAPSASRLMVNWLAGLCTYAATMYWTMPLVDIAVYAVTMSVGPFLGLMTAVIGLFIAILLALRAGFTAYSFVAAVDSDTLPKLGSSIKDAASRKVSLVRGWFQPAEREFAEYPQGFGGSAAQFRNAR